MKTAKKRRITTPRFKAAPKGTPRDEPYSAKTMIAIEFKKNKDEILSTEHWRSAGESVRIPKNNRIFYMCGGQREYQQWRLASELYHLDKYDPLRHKPKAVYLSVEQLTGLAKTHKEHGNPIGINWGDVYRGFILLPTNCPRGIFKIRTADLITLSKHTGKLDEREKRTTDYFL